MDVMQEGIKVKGGWRCQTWWSLRLWDFIGVSNQGCYLVAEFDNSDFIFPKIAALSTSIEPSLNVSACLIGVGNLMGQASPVQAIVMERWGIESADMEVVQENVLSAACMPWAAQNPLWSRQKSRSLPHTS
ncbi:hypothetical protein MHU86_5287 [Fragilaria crotonensis]|nr:hypothetical protein MHU86_5287 [Fragilaria crotonensis]